MLSEEVLAVVAAEKEGEAVQVGAEGVQAVGGVADVCQLGAGLQPAAGYTVQAAVEEWLEHGLPGWSARTVQLYRDGVKPPTDRLGPGRCGKLSAADVWSALV